MPNWQTVFADFREISQGRQYIQRLKEEMLIGVNSINAPTANNGCRVAVQVPMDRVKDAHAIIAELRGNVGPTVPRRKESEKPAKADKAPKAEKTEKAPKAEKTEKAPKRSKKNPGVCPFCNKQKKDLDKHLGETHLKEQGKETKDGDSGSGSGSGEQGDTAGSASDKEDNEEGTEEGGHEDSRKEDSEQEVKQDGEQEDSRDGSEQGHAD